MSAMHTASDYYRRFSLMNKTAFSPIATMAIVL